MRTAKKRGMATSTAGSNCQSLPRRAAGESGGTTTMTPTEASAAAYEPSPSRTQPAIANNPAAATTPLVT